jgi:signal transduction histidine kinase/CheY-like chemotaxis protein
MSDVPPVDTRVQRDLLQMALRNASDSVALLLLAVVFVAWLGWEAGREEAALGVLVIGLVVSVWRWTLRRRHGATGALEPQAIRRVVLELEGNAVLVGLMWALATVAIYPALRGTTASVYVIMLSGSLAMAAFFLSVAGRSFQWLTVLQVGSLATVSLLDPAVRSPALAGLAMLFGATMLKATREFRAATERSLRLALEAREANASLQRAKDAAEAANIAKSRFLATMSHEIRTPMNGVLGALDLLRHTPLESRQKRLVQTAAASGESLMDILNDVLDHSKIEAGKLQQVLAPMSLHAVAGAATALFRANAESRGLELVLDLADDVPDGVVGDAPRLKQVLLNLVGNAVKFTERGRIVLRLRALPAPAGHCHVRFEVEDTGIGIPVTALQQIFEPFHQVDSTRARLRGGTGLGLAISQRIVQAMGGRIEVQSRLGQGSVFAFELALPLARALPPRVTESGFGALDPAAPGLAGTVLLVEDNLVNRMIGVEMLRSFGLQVLEAEDGAQSLTMLEQQPVDLVLMDIQMPVMDGYAATQRMREREARLRLARVPIIALTANAFEEDAAQSLAAGMDAHLAKPYAREQLRDLLQRWLPSA